MASKDTPLNPAISPAGSTSKSRAFPVILRAGLLCGAMDITAAFVTWAIQGVKPVIILQGIASGLLGPTSFQGGWKTAALGGVLHFTIAFTGATVFYDASRSLRFMTRRPILSGVLYGVVVYLVMYWIVMPLSNIHRRPFSLTATVIAIVTHMVCVGLPISLVVRRYSK
ncbi:MAG: hypothetical protein LAO31_21915 [Acidobacteriia bacterium]|nr:hypothetical protein [Terriglobia bacterium]